MQIRERTQIKKKRERAPANFARTHASTTLLVRDDDDEDGWSWVPYQLVAELNGGVMVAPLLPLAAAAEHADPLEPRLPHRHAGLTTDRCCRLYTVL